MIARDTGRPYRASDSSWGRGVNGVDKTDELLEKLALTKLRGYMRLWLAASACQIGFVAGGQLQGIEWPEVWKTSAIVGAEKNIWSRC